MARMVVVGEGMLELSRAGEAWRLAHGGDTLNTAIHLARLGDRISYVTALGTDPFSDDLCSRWATEGIDTTLVLRDETRLPGLYAIRTDAAGERSFSYWRETSAARRLFDLAGAERIVAAAADADLLYFSLISLAILPESGRHALLALAEETRRRGGRVAFDGNYRPRLWEDAATAIAVRDAAIARCDVGLPTLEDERALSGAADGAAVCAHWRGLGARHVVAKLGADGCLVDGDRLIPPAARLVPVDTSGAGDAFNAGYLHAWMRGADPEAAALAGHRLAGWTVMRPGAVPAADGEAPYSR